MIDPMTFNPARSPPRSGHFFDRSTTRTTVPTLPAASLLDTSNGSAIIADFPERWMSGLSRTPGKRV